MAATLLERPVTGVEQMRGVSAPFSLGYTEDFLIRPDVSPFANFVDLQQSGVVGGEHLDASDRRFREAHVRFGRAADRIAVSSVPYWQFFAPTAPRSDLQRNPNGIDIIDRAIPLLSAVTGREETEFRDEVACGLNFGSEHVIKGLRALIRPSRPLVLAGGDVRHDVLPLRVEFVADGADRTTWNIGSRALLLVGDRVKPQALAPELIRAVASLRATHEDRGSSSAEQELAHNFYLGSIERATDISKQLRKSNKNVTALMSDIFKALLHKTGVDDKVTDSTLAAFKSGKLRELEDSI